MGEWEQEHREANRRILQLLVISLVVFGGFTVWVAIGFNETPNNKFWDDKFWDWSISVVGTFVSFLFGLFLGAWHLYRQTTATRRRRREELLHLLVVELKDTCDALRDAENKLEELDADNIKLRLLDVVKSKQPGLMAVHPLVLEEVVKSNLFAHGQTEDGELTNEEMLHLAKAYHKYNEYVASLRAAREPGSLKGDAKIYTRKALRQTDAVLCKLKRPP